MIVSTCCARSLGDLGRNNCRVSAVSNVSVSGLPVNMIVVAPIHSISPRLLLLPPGDIVASLGSAEQMEPAEVGSIAILINVWKTL